MNVKVLQRKDKMPLAEINLNASGTPSGLARRESHEQEDTKESQPKKKHIPT